MFDAVAYFNGVLLDVFRDVGGPCGPLTRGGAMMHAAIHDAVNSIAGGHEPYFARYEAAASASLPVAVAHAAHGALAATFAGTNVDLDRRRDAAIAAAGAGTAAVAAGAAVGRQAAAAIVAMRAHDGADPATAAPHWPQVKPFCMRAGDQFRPPPAGGYASRADLLASPEYAAQLDEVARLGGADSIERMPDETLIAFFWANDIDGTFALPGQLLEVTRSVAAQRGLDVVATARLLALAALALADAAIVACDAKYAPGLLLPRPQTAIQAADGDGDAALPGWRPLSRAPGGSASTPPTPAYVSGHATLAAAHAAVMRLCLGTDNVRFDVATEDPRAGAAGTTRTFDSFTRAALECGRSRVLLGMQFQCSADAGFHCGNALGEYVVATQLRPLVTPLAA